MYVILIKWWMIKLFKTISCCVISWEIKQRNVHCSTPVGVCTMRIFEIHYNDVIKGAMASQITNRAIVYSTVHTGAYPRKHQSSASLAFVRGLPRGPVNSPHKWPVTRKMIQFDDVIMNWQCNNEFMCLYYRNHRNLGVIMMPTLSSLAAPEDPVPPVTTKLTSWQISRFSDIIKRIRKWLLRMSRNTTSSYMRARLHVPGDTERFLLVPDRILDAIWHVSIRMIFVRSRSTILARLEKLS